MNLDLEGKVALVTGGSRGIGRAVALAFAGERASVGITFATDAQAAEGVVAECSQAGAPEAQALQLELGSDESIDAAVEAVLDRFGRIDALVNNAGPMPTPGRFDSQLEGQLRQALRINLEGPARIIQRVVPAMRDGEGGRIVNVSTVHAQDGAPGVVSHTTAKSALHGLTKSLSRELAADNILVNVVMPALTLTEGVLGRFPAERVAAAAQRNPTGRNPEASELARLILFLASPGNAHVNGELIRHAGGL